MNRYRRAGALYDIASLEVFLYRWSRARLAELLGGMSGDTVVDLGCGTGLNFGWLRDAVRPGGTVIGLDDSPSMLAAARRRIERHGWTDVELIRADLTCPDDTAQVPALRPGAVVATFVLSLLPDATACWSAIDTAASATTMRVAIADLGQASGAPPVLRQALRTLTSLGGGDPERRPWEQLAVRADDVRHEVRLGGHVHLAIGTCRSG